LTKIPLIWSVSYFNLRGLGDFLGRAKPTKAPRMTTGLKVLVGKVATSRKKVRLTNDNKKQDQFYFVSV